MKKLILSALVALTTTAQANIAVELTFKQDDQEIVVNEVILTNENNTSLYNINDETFKVAFVESALVDEQQVIRLSIYRTVDGSEELIAQPEFFGMPAQVTLSNTTDGAERSLTIKVKEAY